MADANGVTGNSGAKQPGAGGPAQVVRERASELARKGVGTALRGAEESMGRGFTTNLAVAVEPIINAIEAVETAGEQERESRKRQDGARGTEIAEVRGKVKKVSEDLETTKTDLKSDIDAVGNRVTTVETTLIEKIGKTEDGLTRAMSESVGAVAQEIAYVREAVTELANRVEGLECVDITDPVTQEPANVPVTDAVAKLADLLGRTLGVQSTRDDEVAEVREGVRKLISRANALEDGSATNQDVLGVAETLKDEANRLDGRLDALTGAVNAVKNGFDAVVAEGVRITGDANCDLPNAIYAMVAKVVMDILGGSAPAESGPAPSEPAGEA